MLAASLNIEYSYTVKLVFTRMETVMHKIPPVTHWKTSLVIILNMNVTDSQSIHNKASDIREFSSVQWSAAVTILV